MSERLLSLLIEHRLTIALLAALLATGGTALGFYINRRMALRRRIRMVLRGSSLQMRQGDGRGGNDLGNIERRLRSAERQKEGGERNKPRRSVEDRLAEAGLPLDAAQFWRIAVGSGLLGVAVVLALRPEPLLIVAVALSMGLGLPFMVLALVARRRRGQFLANLPDALEVMVRGLKAGLPVNEALAMIGREFKPPIATEFGIVTDEQSAGYSLAEAMERCARRMPLPEMHMLAIAITIQAQTGGSLSETLQNLADVIRARFRLQRKVKALTSEATASAGIIGSLPFLLSGAITFVAPDYMAPMAETRLGNLLLVGAGVWLVIGVLVMAKMIHIRV